MKLRCRPWAAVLTTAALATAAVVSTGYLVLFANPPWPTASPVARLVVLAVVIVLAAAALSMWPVSGPVQRSGGQSGPDRTAGPLTDQGPPPLDDDTVGRPVRSVGPVWLTGQRPASPDRPRVWTSLDRPPGRDVVRIFDGLDTHDRTVDDRWRCSTGGPARKWRDIPAELRVDASRPYLQDTKDGLRFAATTPLPGQPGGEPDQVIRSIP